ncbi:NAD-dependent epimerase/dehydratase family protein [Megamonas funiformis]|uniref:NAD-dependent epimerase/dehydratase family protein n=1 Tax=Megamonas funiformis TaxID=437897 RepID=UPI001CD289FB|nr:NAD-dependent epimerase/dehydratase family protein [Megamonas funiformis]UBS48147.1 NAD-dependent epimerase/dehydratase family protein [Megamonas funiformis]GLU98389.1 nucleotide sugar dehydratase [Megamonas funiformis]
MWINNKIFKEDMEYIIHANFINWENLSNKTIFITGVTGLIGYYLTSSLVYKNIKENSNIKILALVRDIEKARLQFKEHLKVDNNLNFICGDLNNIPNISEKIDYIIHGASPTSSKSFVENPVEVIKTIYDGAVNVLELAKNKNIKNMVYLSTMEVYGVNKTHDKVDEEHESYLNTMNARNSYPESKRLCENLCASYYSEYNVPVNVLRLTQTFGPGIKENDNRVFAQFIRASIEKKDIILLTEGKTYRNYLYLADAVTAILTILLSEKYGEAYNVANEETYCSIKEMAELVASDISNKEIKVIFNFDDKRDTKIFMPQMCMNLDIEKLKNIGWKSSYNLKTMYKRTIFSIKNVN